MFPTSAAFDQQPELVGGSVPFTRTSAASPEAPPRTEALRRALRGCIPAAAPDLRFLEAWECDPVAGAGAALRYAQIRRANPGLVAEIRRELEDARARSRSAGAGLRFSERGQLRGRSPS